MAATPVFAKTEGFKNPFAAAKKFFAPSVAGPKVPLIIQRQRTNEIWSGEVGTSLKEKDQEALNHLLRDIDAKSVKEIDPELIYLAARLQDQIGAAQLLVVEVD